MKVYIAGPMTGLPQFNIPAFDGAATALRAHGYEVVSPAELDNPETRKLALASQDGAAGTGSANGETWGDLLARDVKLIADSGIEGIVLLYNWHLSRGARLEATVGLLCGLKFALYDPSQIGLVKPVDRGYMLSRLHDGFLQQFREEAEKSSAACRLGG